MFEFLKIQYELKTVDDKKLATYVPKYISADQFKQITGEDYAAPTS